MTREQQHMAMESQIKQQQMARDAEFGEASHNQRMEQMKQQAAQKKQATNGKEAA
jgi:(p)ppGpp synthase/HD superfamily hydrolase